MAAASTHTRHGQAAAAMDDQPPLTASDTAAAMELDDDQPQPQPTSAAIAPDDAELFDVDGLLVAMIAVPPLPQSEFVRRQRRLIGPLWRMVTLRCGDEGSEEGRRPASPTAAPQLALTADHACALLRVALNADPTDAESEMLVSQCGGWWRHKSGRLYKGSLSQSAAHPRARCSLLTVH